MKPPTDVEAWLKKQLSSVLGFDVPQDMVQYILKIDNVADMEEYMGTLLDFKQNRHQKFFSDFMELRCFNGLTNARRSKKLSVNDLNLEMGKCAITGPSEPDAQPDAGTRRKKKDKYVNLYSAEAAGRDVILLKGRHSCDCQAIKHGLINNCLSCGRIVCEQEGSGPCFFCGELVCSKEEKEILNSENNKSKKLYKDLMETGRPSGDEKAVAHRDRLLEYDRTSQRRTKVIDDEGEYYSTKNAVWLSAKEREKQTQIDNSRQEKRHASRLSAKFTLDFAGRQVVEENIQDEEFYDAEDSFDIPSSSSIAPDIHLDWTPEYLPSNDAPKAPPKGVRQINSTVGPRVQDKELLEMSDTGACLSLHQPWASLVTAGIKMHEGRTWYTPHRGRLWIAAASKPPSEEVIKETENFYRQLFHGRELKFPREYPVSCLLGCVNLVDCIPQEEYQSKFDRPESDSPFVFICTDAQALSLKFPISGQHKIYKLEKQIHATAQKMLLQMQKRNASRS